MSYTPPVGSPNYMGDWGHSNTKHVASKIDHIADKAKFGLDMLQNALVGFDGIEKELVEISNAPTPPHSQTLRSLAHRIDTYQQQLRNGMDQIKHMMTDIDKETDTIQRQKTSW